MAGLRPVGRRNELNRRAPSGSLGGDLGRRYAAVSGDRNPIHMHSLSAKALGFPGAIAHGMWTKARCLAALESRLPDAFAVDGPLPQADPAAGTGRVRQPPPTDEEIDFAVRDAKRGTPHLDGRVGPLEDQRQRREEVANAHRN